jgi:hypothetical protein
MPATPMSDMATVNSPDTAPPRSAACSAALSELVAAAAVRMFVRIDTHIPMKPAIPEQTAPSRNAPVV